jgi:uncharacterized protein (TIGR02284 family)
MINDYEATEPIISDAAPTHGGDAISNDDIISTLNNLIQTCLDGKDGFVEAAEAVESSETKTFFAQQSQERARFAGELQALVRGLGGDPQEDGSVSGAIHRGWMDLKAAVAGNDEHSVLVECERGEDSAKKAYKDALEQNLPANVRDTVQTQSQAVIASHDRVKALRDGNSTASTAKGGF